MKSGNLRHRITFEKPVYEQDSETGAPTPDWEEVVSVWASIEPLSARDLIAAQAQQSKVAARMVIRHRADIDETMRITHDGMIFSIEGLLADKDSGREYITIPVSQGVKQE